MALPWSQSGTPPQGFVSPFTSTSHQCKSSPSAENCSLPVQVVQIQHLLFKGDKLAICMSPVPSSAYILKLCLSLSKVSLPCSYLGKGPITKSPSSEQSHSFLGRELSCCVDQVSQLVSGSACEDCCFRKH